MSEKYTAQDARTQSASDYRAYRDAYGAREKHVRDMESSDALARTLARQLLRHPELIKPALFTDAEQMTEETRQFARKMQKAEAAEDAAHEAEFQSVVAGMDIQNALEKGEEHFQAHRTEYHVAALEDATTAGVRIKQQGN